MVVLRATKKVLTRLHGPTADAGESDTALGDWYVTRVVVDRQPLLLLISSKSSLPIIVPAKGVADLPSRLAQLVATRLRRMGIPLAWIDAEVRAMDGVVVAPTNSRSVNGILVQCAKALPSYLPINGWDATTLPFVEHRIAETPWHAGGRFEDTIFPDMKTPELLAAAWGL